MRTKRKISEKRKKYLICFQADLSYEFDEDGDKVVKKKTKKSTTTTTTEVFNYSHYDFKVLLNLAH